MILFEQIIEWLWILTGLLFLAVLGYLAMTALSLKTAAMRDVKRLSQPPINSVKSLVGTGKGIVQQEGIRVKHIAANVKAMAGDIKVTATQVGGAAKTVHPDELKSAMANVQNTLKFVSVLVNLTHASSHQKRS